MGVKNINDNTIKTLESISVQTLPNNPSAVGYTAESIKKKFYDPVLNPSCSILTEINRIVGEVNNELELNEKSENKVNEITTEANNVTYPTTKAVKDYVDTKIEESIAKVNTLLGDTEDLGV
ncbi:MAG: hypothetical protein IJW82_07540 [Clostridia bacterium]|nr:hypothetical protein [Clostridia bacterium]